MPLTISFLDLRNRSQALGKRWTGTLLSLDPGHTTGYAVWKCTQEFVQLVEVGHVTTWTGDDLTFDKFEDILKAYPITHVVMETYQVYEWKSSDHSWSQVPTIQIIGCIKTLCQQRKIPYSSQTAQVAKQFCTDEKLQQWNFYKPGLRHGRDAIRHGSYFILFRK